MWFGVFGPNFPKFPQYPSTCETGIARPIEGSDTGVRSHLMRNKELKTLDYFSCVPAHDVGYSDPISPNCPNTQIPVKQVWLDPQRTLTLELGLIWCETRSWRLWITFHMSLHMIWGIQIQFLQIAPIPEYLWNRYNSLHKRALTLE